MLLEDMATRTVSVGTADDDVSMAFQYVGYVPGPY